MLDLLGQERPENVQRSIDFRPTPVLHCGAGLEAMLDPSGEHQRAGLLVVEAQEPDPPAVGVEIVPPHVRKRIQAECAKAYRAIKGKFQDCEPMGDLLE